jgi:hypothetical protein
MVWTFQSCRPSVENFLAHRALDGLFGFGRRGVVGTQEEGGGLAGVAVECVHGVQRDVLARALAMLHDATHGKLMVQRLHRLADLDAVSMILSRRLQVVDDDVIWVPERTARDESERSQSVVRGKVNAVDILDRAAEGELDVDRGHDLHMRQFAQHIGDTDVGRSRAGAEQRVGRAWAHDHVHACTRLLRARAVQDAEENGHDRKDHHHFDRYGNSADDRAQGAVHEIAKDKFIHRGSRFSNAGCKVGLFIVAQSPAARPRHRAA